MKHVVSFAIGALVLASCGGGGSSAPATATLDVTTSVAETTPSTTTPPSTIAVTTTAATTTLPATTTTVATEDLIKQAVQDYSDAYHACGLAPAACVPGSFTATQGRSRSIITELATGMTEQGLYFADDLRGSYLSAETISVASPTQASAIYCVFDAATVMGPIGPDGQPTVVNDEILSLRNDYHLFLEDGMWKVGEQLQLEVLPNGISCPPDA